MSAQAQDSYSREFPQVVECSNCFSASQFEAKAKETVSTNESHHVIVFSSDYQEFRTFFVVNIYDPEFGMEINEAHAISNLPKHINDFNEYLDLVAFDRQPRAEDAIKNLIYPSNEIPTADYGFVADVSTWARNQLLQKSIWYNFTDVVVSVYFSSGYTINLILKARSTTFVLISIVDSDGNIIATQLNGMSSNTGNGGGIGDSSSYGQTAGNTITIQLFGGSSERTVRVCTGTADNMVCRNIIV
ncbi:hypothetical protein [Rheinheimera maricola]|uniref:Uncharacterized protein n=1 Tax=Rheinheimera maricola TaxID=2793282 RepID=A0ABS7X971_9GAMM|nr:hypothetical protein [Rheinheimera maricola]MBZ9612093.1 hypothetical protein [Rheinheimera maricola]